MKRIPFTNTEREKIIEMWKNGFGVTQICKKVKSLNWRKPQTLYPVLIKEGLYKKKPKNDLRKHYVNDYFFDDLTKEKACYWLGWMISDGYITNSGHSKHTFGITVQTSDKEILEKFKKDLDTNYEIHDYSSENEIDGYRFTVNYSKITICSKRIYERLLSLGITNKKSYNAIIPMNEIPSYNINHVIRGIFDGDGGFVKSGDKKYHTYDIKITGTFEVLSTIKNILNKTVKLCQRFPERNNNNYTLTFCGDRQVYKIGKWLYDKATVYLERKHKRFIKLQAKYLK